MGETRASCILYHWKPTLPHSSSGPAFTTAQPHRSRMLRPGDGHKLSCLHTGGAEPLPALAGTWWLSRENTCSLCLELPPLSWQNWITNISPCFQTALPQHPRGLNPWSDKRCVCLQGLIKYTIKLEGRCSSTPLCTALCPCAICWGQICSISLFSTASIVILCTNLTGTFWTLGMCTSMGRTLFCWTSTDQYFGKGHCLISVNLFLKMIININWPTSRRLYLTVGRLLARELTESPSGQQTL